MIVGKRVLVKFPTRPHAFASPSSPLRNPGTERAPAHLSSRDTLKLAIRAVGKAAKLATRLEPRIARKTKTSAASFFLSSVFLFLIYNVRNPFLLCFGISSQIYFGAFLFGLSHVICLFIFVYVAWADADLFAKLSILCFVSAPCFQRRILLGC